MWRIIEPAAFAAVITVGFNRLKGIIMATQAENQAAIDAVAAQVAKAKAEIVARIDDLEQAANAGQTLDFSALRGDVQALDDLNPDPVVEPEQPAE